MSGVTLASGRRPFAKHDLLSQVLLVDALELVDNFLVVFRGSHRLQVEGPGRRKVRWQQVIHRRDVCDRLQGWRTSVVEMIPALRLPALNELVS